MAWGIGSSKRTSTAEHKARRIRVLRRDNYECQIKGPNCIGKATICDHIVAIALGGADTDDNCQAACEPCHKWKTAQEAKIGLQKRRSAARRRYSGHPGDDPAR